MGLKGDIEEIKAVWSKSSWWFRGWLCLSGYLALSSIASMSETVVKWKGFILDGITFYRGYISAPFSALARLFGIHLSPLAADMAVINMIVMASILRAAICTHRKPLAVWQWVLVVAIFPTFSITTVSRLNNTTVSAKALIMSTFLVLMLPGLVWRGRERRTRVKVFYAQIGVIAFLLGVLAAINKGIYG